MQELVSMWWMFAVTAVVFSIVAVVAAKKKTYFAAIAYAALALMNFGWVIYLLLMV